MKNFRHIFTLLGDLPYGGAKMKKFKIKWGLMPMSGGFIFCSNHTEGEIMIKTKKRIIENQQLVKKLKIFEGIFRFPGFLPYVKGKQK